MYVSNALAGPTVKLEAKGTSLSREQDDETELVLADKTFYDTSYDDIISQLFQTKPHPAVDRRHRADKRSELIQTKFKEHFDGERILAQ